MRGYRPEGEYDLDEVDEGYLARPKRPAPGKVTRTSKLPGKHGSVQREPRGGVAPSAPGSAAGSVGRQASEDGPVEDWTLVALQPRSSASASRPSMRHP
jgi:hypothetical protein